MYECTSYLYDRTTANWTKNPNNVRQFIVEKCEFTSYILKLSQVSTEHYAWLRIKSSNRLNNEFEIKLKLNLYFCSQLATLRMAPQNFYIQATDPLDVWSYPVSNLFRKLQRMYLSKSNIIPKSFYLIEICHF